MNKLKAILARLLSWALVKEEVKEGHILITKINIPRDTVRTTNQNCLSFHTLLRQIEEEGILEPITVCISNDRLELVDGQQRLTCAHLLGLKQVPFKFLVLT